MVSSGASSNSSSTHHGAGPPPGPRPREHDARLPSKLNQPPYYGANYYPNQPPNYPGFIPKDGVSPSYYSNPANNNYMPPYPQQPPGQYQQQQQPQPPQQPPQPPMMQPNPVNPYPVMQQIPPPPPPAGIHGPPPQLQQPPGAQPAMMIPPAHLPGPSVPKKRPHPGAQSTTRATSTYPRKRALTACDTCRLKKVKCDNVRPRCGACAKNGNNNCHYRTDDQVNDYSSFDPASLNILSKLDLILSSIKQLNPLKNLLTPEEMDDVKPSIPRKYNIKFDKCIWDMSMTSIFKWNFMKKSIDQTDSEVSSITSNLIKSYNHTNSAIPKQGINHRMRNWELIEDILLKHFSVFINSFFLNCHTKIPVLNVLELLESIEIYNLMKKYDPSLSFPRILQDFDPENFEENLPSFYYESLKKFNIKDTKQRRLNFRNLCLSVPLILVICCLGIISTPIQLNNVGLFLNSLEERDSLLIGCLPSDNLPDGLGSENKTRFLMSQLVLNYSQMIAMLYPWALQDNTLISVEYYILMNQYNLLIMNPLKAYDNIAKACHSMMFFLEMSKNAQNNGEDDEVYIFDTDEDPNSKEIIDRLFWTCLKLESELRVELSPHVSLSGITQVVPPSSFPKIPDPIVDSEGKYSEESLKLAKKYDDHYSWYYFLTEVAVRKVDNSMFDEMFSYGEDKLRLINDDNFVNFDMWKIFIKYLNQYNGIINSLSPKIRKFVLQEVNVEQIYMSMKKKQTKKHANIKEDFDIFDTLDDFLIDDDLLLRAQSESIMFIKTRIVTSKLVLFRSIIYLILEDKVDFQELMMAAMSIIPAIKSQSELGVFNESGASPAFSSGSGDSLGNNELSSNDSNSQMEMDMDYYELLNAPQFYQKQFPDEDFSNLMEPDDSIPNDFKLTDVKQARSKILKVFVQNLISIPKLNIPKLGAHRHPGSWYYLRNTLIGSLYMFLLYKKIQEMVAAAATNEAFIQQINSIPSGPSLPEIMEMVNLMILKQSVKATLEHALVIYNYWKKESPDCQIYYDYIQQCLDHLG